MNYSSQEKTITTTSIGIFGIIAALAMLGVVVVTVVTIPQQEAEGRGCKSSVAINASKGRCFHP
ncbi:MAG TPA: hypothetical protein VFH09_02290 [Nitrososphaera sp.]|nr:hypothetical protein [Nitrososphaera sp.]